MIQYYTQYLSTLAVSSGVLCSATYQAWSPLLIFLTDESPTGSQLSTLELAWIIAIYYLGGVMASPLVPTLLEKLGRKKSMMLAAGILAVSWFPIMFGTNFLVILAGRALGGAAAVTACTAAQVYIGEISEDEFRGTFASSYFLFFSTGTWLAVLLRLYASYTTIGVIGVVVAVLYFLTITLVTESPYYYMEIGLEDEAKKVLIHLEPANLDHFKIERKFLHIKESVRDDISHSSESIFGTSLYRKHILILVGLKICQQVCGQPVISNFIIIYGVAYAGISQEATLMSYYSLHCVMAFVSMSLADKLGRKFLLMGSLIICAATLCVLRIFYYIMDYDDATSIMVLPFLMSLVFAAAASFGIYSVPYVIMGEIFPANIKSSAVAFSMFLEFGMDFIFIWWINPLMFESGPHSELWVYTVCCIVGALYVYSCVPETRKMSFENMQKMLKKHPIQ